MAAPPARAGERKSSSRSASRSGEDDGEEKRTTSLRPSGGSTASAHEAKDDGGSGVVATGRTYQRARNNSLTLQAVPPPALAGEAKLDTMLTPTAVVVDETGATSRYSSAASSGSGAMAPGHGYHASQFPLLGGHNVQASGGAEAAAAAYLAAHQAEDAPGSAAGSRSKPATQSRVVHREDLI
jgi:hypothetical protein